jgi:hypothetical protein
MGLLDGGIASIFSAALSGIYLDASLHRWSSTEDGVGGGTSTFAAPEAVKAQLDRENREVAAVGQRILVLAHGVAQIGPDDEITVDGTRYSFGNVDRDPAGSYYDLTGAIPAKVGRG